MSKGLEALREALGCLASTNSGGLFLGCYQWRLQGHGAGSGGCLAIFAQEELGVKKERDLLVLTWGKALRKSAPPESEHNFNAGILNGRGGGWWCRLH